MGTPLAGDALAATKEAAFAAPAASRRSSRKAETPALAAASTAPRASDDGRVYAQAELPDAVRRDMPKLVVGGASYSKDAASRMVILNGQVFHEGDTIAPGLVLHQIKLKTALLTFKSYRFELAY
jgi:general secretion pathway protein B